MEPGELSSKTILAQAFPRCDSASKARWKREKELFETVAVPDFRRLQRRYTIEQAGYLAMLMAGALTLHTNPELGVPLFTGAVVWALSVARRIKVDNIHIRLRWIDYITRR